MYHIYYISTCIVLYLCITYKGHKGLMGLQGLPGAPGVDGQKGNI